MAAFGAPLRQTAFWLASGNGRLLMPSRERQFDRALQRIIGGTQSPQYTK
jgi:hypothetical protein